MVSLDPLTVSFISIILFNSVHGSLVHGNTLHYNRHTFHPRNYVTPAQRSSSYDYVIAGGGLAGLVLASRLSDDPSISVLVLEAGPSGDANPTSINVPQETYFNSLLGNPLYDWVYSTVPQANASGRTMTQPRGKVLGGSSAVNGMYNVRPSKVEVDTWSSLISPNDQSAADTWNWDSFFDALKKVETFSPPLDAVESVAGMKYAEASHGTSGPLHVTYPAYMSPVSGTWLPSLEAAGVATSSDSYSGVNIGGMFALSTINPSNWTRSYSKSAWIDTLPPRSNLHIISDATVEKIAFSDNLVNGERVASSVKFSTGKGTPVLSVDVNKEAILSGGAMGTPHLLLVSGVGPKDVLDGANVPVKNELPGVGQHFMDHLAVSVVYPTTAETQGSVRQSGSDFSKSAEFNSFINSGVAYINGSRLFGGDADFNAFQQDVANPTALAEAQEHVPSQYAPVIEGYKSIYKATSEQIYPSVALVEILLSVNAANAIAIQAALQQPLSHGRLSINSASIYDKPLIDPQYFSHPADIVLLRQGLKLARQIGGTAPLSNSLGEESTPGGSVQTDQQIENWIQSNANTEYHPCGGAAMLPQNEGGVVDAQLKVYGLSNVRVVDSSVFPVSFSSHLMAPTYALAEKAAELILNPPTTQISTTSSGSGSPTGSSTTPGQSDKSAAFRRVSTSLITLLPILLLAAWLL